MIIIRTTKLSKPVVISIIAIMLVLISTAVLGLTNIFAQSKLDNLVDRRDVGTFVPNKPYEDAEATIVGSIETRIIEIPYNLWQETRDTMEDTNGKEGNSHEQGKDFLSYFYKKEGIEPYMIIGNINNDIYEVDGDANYYVVNCKSLNLINGSIYYFIVANNNDFAELRDVSKYYFDDDNDILYLAKDLLDGIIEKDGEPLRSEALVVCEDIETATKSIEIETVFSEDVEVPRALERAVINGKNEFNIRDCQFDCVKFQLVEPDGLAYISEGTVFVYANGKLFDDWMYNEATGEMFLGLDIFETRTVSIEIKCINDVTKQQIKLLKSIQNDKDMIPCAGYESWFVDGSNPFFSLQYSGGVPTVGSVSQMDGELLNVDISELNQKDASWALVWAQTASDTLLGETDYTWWQTIIGNTNYSPDPSDFIDKYDTEFVTYVDENGDEQREYSDQVRDERKILYLARDVQKYLYAGSVRVANSYIDNYVFTGSPGDNSSGYFDGTSIAKPENRMVERSWQSVGRNGKRYFMYSSDRSFLGATEVKAKKNNPNGYAIIDGDCCHIAASYQGTAPSSSGVNSSNYQTRIIKVLGPSDNPNAIITCLYGTSLPRTNDTKLTQDAQRIQSYSKIDVSCSVDIQVKKTNEDNGPVGETVRYTMKNDNGYIKDITLESGSSSAVKGVPCGYYDFIEDRSHGAPIGYKYRDYYNELINTQNQIVTLEDPYQMCTVTLQVFDETTRGQHEKGVEGLTFVLEDENGNLINTVPQAITTGRDGRATFTVKTLDCNGNTYLNQQNVVTNYKTGSDCHKIPVGEIRPTDSGEDFTKTVTHYEPRQYVTIHTHVQDEHIQERSSATFPSGGTTGTSVSLAGSVYDLYASSDLFVGYSGNSIVTISEGDFVVGGIHSSSANDIKNRLQLSATHTRDGYRLPTGSYSWVIRTPSNGYSLSLSEQKIPGTEWDRDAAARGEDLVVSIDDSYVRQKRQTVSIDVLTKGYSETESVSGSHIRTTYALKIGFGSNIGSPFNTSVSRSLYASGGSKPTLNSTVWANVSNNSSVKAERNLSGVRVAIINKTEIVDIKGNRIPAGTVVAIAGRSESNALQLYGSAYEGLSGYSGYEPVASDYNQSGISCDNNAVTNLPNGEYIMYAVTTGGGLRESGFSEDYTGTDGLWDSSGGETVNTYGVIMIKVGPPPPPDSNDDLGEINIEYPIVSIYPVLDLPINTTHPYSIDSSPNNILIGDIPCIKNSATTWQQALNWIKATNMSGSSDSFVPRVAYRMIDRDNIGELEGTDKTFSEVIDPLPTTFAYYIDRTDYKPIWEHDKWTYYVYIENCGKDVIVNQNSAGWDGLGVVGNHYDTLKDRNFNHRAFYRRPVMGALSDVKWLDSALKASPNNEVLVTFKVAGVLDTIDLEWGEDACLEFTSETTVRIVGRNMFMLD